MPAKMPAKTPGWFGYSETFLKCSCEKLAEELATLRSHAFFRFLLALVQDFVDSDSYSHWAQICMHIIFIYIYVCKCMQHATTTCGRETASL